MLTNETTVEDLESELTTSIRVSVDPTDFTPTVLMPRAEIDVDPSVELEDVTAEPSASAVVVEAIPVTSTRPT